MQSALLEEKRVGTSAGPLPYLSYSRISRYLLCPEQYRLYYVENLRPRVRPASLIFGKILHETLALFFKKEGDPLALFAAQWNQAKEVELRYAYRESWEKLSERGEALLKKFVSEEAPRFGKVIACEQAFELAITSINVPFVGVIDLVTDLETKCSDSEVR